MELWMKDLNPAQQEAVCHTEGPLLILAGAGSGKTRVLTYRIAKLLLNGVNSRNILAVTFTNKAAQEMRERVSALIGPQAESIWLATFHATCVRILRQDGAAIGLDKNFVIYDSSDQLTVVKQVMRELNLSENNFNPQMQKMNWLDQRSMRNRPQISGQKLLGRSTLFISRDYGRIPLLTLMI